MDFKEVFVESSYPHTLRIPRDWVFTELSEAINVIGGSQPPKSEFSSEPKEGFIRLIQIRDYKSDQHKVFIPKDKARRFVKPDDVMIGRYGPPIFQILKGLEGAYNVALMKAEPVAGVMDNRYLYFYLQNRDIYNYVEAASDRTAGQSGVNKEHLEKYPVGLPPLAEQKVIADKLDTLLAQVNNTKARLERIPEILKSFRQSVLAAAVTGKLTEEWRIGKSQDQLPKLDERFVIAEEYFFEVPNEWKLTAIGNCATFQQGLQIAKATRRSESDDDVLPILRTVNYENNFIDDVHYALVDDKSIIAEPQDIIISRTGTVGRVLTGYRGIMHNNSFRINYDKQLILREYLIYFLKSPICQEYVKENSGRSTQPDLTHKAFAKCPLALPSVLEQSEIIRRVEKLFAIADRIEQAAQAAQSRVNNLTQSILAKAFRGELTADWRTANPDLISGDNSAEALLAKIKAERAKLSKKAKAKA